MYMQQTKTEVHTVSQHVHTRNQDWSTFRQPTCTCNKPGLKYTQAANMYTHETKIEVRTVSNMHIHGTRTKVHTGSQHVHAINQDWSTHRQPTCTYTYTTSVSRTHSQRRRGLSCTHLSYSIHQDNFRPIELRRSLAPLRKIIFSRT